MIKTDWNYVHSTKIIDLAMVTSASGGDYVSLKKV